MQVPEQYSLNIRNNMRYYREKLGYSQEYLAELLDCSREHIVRIENGKLNIGLGNFIKLAEIFNTTLDKLAGFKKTNNLL